MVKNPPAMREAWVLSLGWEVPWRRAWQPTPVFLPGKSPWTEERGGPQSMGSQRVGHDWATKHRTGLQSQTQRGLVFWCRTPGLGSLVWDSDLSILQENFCNIIILECVVTHPEAWGLTVLWVCPFYLSRCGPFFILQLQKILPARFWSFSSMIILQTAGIWVCSWKEVSFLTVFLLCRAFYIQDYILFYSNLTPVLSIWLKVDSMNICVTHILYYMLYYTLIFRKYFIDLWWLVIYLCGGSLGLLKVILMQGIWGWCLQKHWDKDRQKRKREKPPLTSLIISPLSWDFCLSFSWNTWCQYTSATCVFHLGCYHLVGCLH